MCPISRRLVLMDCCSITLAAAYILPSRYLPLTIEVISMVLRLTWVAPSDVHSARGQVND